jgi:hypothetical protein
MPFDGNHRCLYIKINRKIIVRISVNTTPSDFTTKFFKFQY